MKVSVTLYEHQREALKQMHNGCILNGGVGSGKSITALAYYYIFIGGGRIKPHIEPMTTPKNLVIITTARKRDTLEWEKELANFGLGIENNELYKDLTISIDSWNNIAKYAQITDAFFIFDEQRVIGNGTWVKSFLKIAKSNQWILLSATPGDTWTDYIPVFIANGFYKNRTEFMQEHVQMRRIGNFWKVDRYFGLKRLERLRDRVLVDMQFERDTEAHHFDVWCEYDRGRYREISRLRWNPWKEEPCENASAMCYVLRRLVNSESDRLLRFLEILDEHPKAIIFYNFDYELDALKEILSGTEYEVAEWNGHKHQPIPEGEKWCFLCQYNAACEGWNCTRTDTIIFYSQNYSYKIMAQASGRIDRLNTPYKDLYYYHLRSHAPIDLAIARAIKDKKMFNEGRYFNKLYKEKEKKNG